MENKNDNINTDNKDIFDYDAYVKAGKRKKKKAKRNNLNQNAKQKSATISSNSTVKDEGKESIENIKRMFDNALDENANEVAELLPETEDEVALEAKTSSDPVKIKRRLYLTFGLIITVLAIVGFFSTISFTADKIAEFTDNTKQKEEFAKYIYPVVICDPPPFDQNVNLRSDTIVTAAIWDIILYEDKSKYVADFDYISVPEVDVEQHAIKLFGSGLNIEHQSITSQESPFYYNPEESCYRIPLDPIFFTYSPVIDEIEKIGERYTLKVGYYPPTPACKKYSNDNEHTPEKFVEYIVTKRDDEYSIIGISQLKSDITSDI